MRAVAELGRPRAETPDQGCEARRPARREGYQARPRIHSDRYLEPRELAQFQPSDPMGRLIEGEWISEWISRGSRIDASNPKAMRSRHGLPELG